MIHAREDYQRFQDPLGKFGAFLMRAQDDRFCEILEAAIDIYRHSGNHAIADRLEGHLELAKGWQRTHPIKVADLPRTPA